jgi:hypothetical protein
VIIYSEEKKATEKYSIEISFSLLIKEGKIEEKAEDALFVVIFSSLGSAAFDSMNNS